MKRSLTLNLIAGLILLLTVGTAEASTMIQEPADLIITQVSPDVEPARAGDPLSFAITYMNQGGEDWPADKSFEISLTLVPAQGPVQRCSTVASAAVALTPGESREFILGDCQIIPPLAGDYTLTASLNDQTFGPRVLKVEEAESALPENISRLFAGIGMFIAMMTIMAVGTEVVIDSARVFLGMKRKVTAMESLTRFEAQIPGQLSALGAGAASQEQLKKLINELRDTLEHADKIVWASEEIRRKIRAGYFGEVLVFITGIIREGEAAPEYTLEELKRGAKDALERGLYELQGKLGLSEDLRRQIRNHLDREIEGLTVETSKDALDTVFKALQGWSPQLVHEWLRNQRDTLVMKSTGEALNLFDREVKPALEGLGLNPKTVESTRQRLELALEVVDAKAMAASDAYIESLKKLLHTVEERRNAVQSPLRKTWRAIRGASFPIWAVVPALLSGAIVWLILSSGNTVIRPILSVLIGLTAGAFVRSLFMSLIANQVRTHLEEQRPNLEQVIFERLPAWEQQKFNALPAKDKLEVRRRAQAFLDLAQGGALEQVARDHGVSPAALYEWDQRFRKRTGVSIVEYLLGQLPPLERLWRLSWLISVGDFLSGLETAWNIFLRRENTQGQVTQDVVQIIDALEEPTDIAAILQEREDKHKDEESSRLRWLRVVSVFVGVALAYLLQIDAAKLLNAAVPGIEKTINVFRLEGIDLHSKLWTRLPSDLDITPGIILTGLAASAGSAFWHDQLDRLQAAKKGAESAARLVQQVKQVGGSQE